jgi:hypothetical protein
LSVLRFPNHAVLLRLLKAGDPKAAHAAFAA